MNLTARRWYPLLLLRDARGRFARLRTALQLMPPAARHARRRSTPVPAMQLALF